MSRTFKVEQTCGRCGRKEEMELSTEEAVALDERDAACDQADQALPQLLNETLTEFHPDVIVAIKDASGRYDVKSLRGLCVTPDAKRNKGCVTRVQALLSEVFKAPKPRTRAPKSPAPEKPETPPTEPDKAPTEPDKAPAKKGDKKK